MLIKVIVYLRNESFRMLVLRVLEQSTSNYEFAIEFCRVASEILEAYKRVNPDLVIMEINRYPFGYEFTQIEKILQIDKGAKVIGVTWLHEEMVAENLQRVGAKGYFLKNMMPDEIINTIYGVLAGKLMINCLTLDADLTESYNLLKAKAYVRKYARRAAPSGENDIFIGWLKNTAVTNLEELFVELEKYLPQSVRKDNPTEGWMLSLEQRLNKIDGISEGKLEQVRWRMTKGMSLIAASLVFFIAICGGLYVLFSSKKFGNHAYGEIVDTDGLNTIFTAKADQKQIELPDGTRVWLNASSTLKYPTRMLTEDRIVELTGEAYFEVEHAASRPFRVKVRNMVIEVLGTKFDIKSYPEETVYRTMVTEGSVKVILGDKEVILTHGEQVEVDATPAPGTPIKVIRGIDPELATGWTKGYLEFHNADLQMVLQDLSRAYDVDIQYEGPIPTNKFYGSFSMQEPLEEIVSRLNFQGFEFTMSRKGGRKVLVKSTTIKE